MRKLVFMLILSLLTVFASHANAASVYISTNSRTYHCDRNCPELNTDNVIEFNSPEEADVAGAIPCGHCKLTTGKLNYNVKNVLTNPVIINGSLGEFRHGTFPSPPLGEFTHVGVDLVAPCGSNVYAFADGRVKDVIDSTSDKDYKTLGYMVLIEHPASLIGKKFYTLYLHMQDSPDVKIGDQVTGGSTVIGKVGDTGNAFGCHTHFEIRYFPERFSTWGNIYGPGDQRASEYLKQNWENPLTFFKKYPNGLKLVKSSEGENNTVKVETDKDNQEKQRSVLSGDIQTEIESNEGEYVGDLKDGVRHGQGTMTFSDGTKYVGGWKDGNCHGQGTVTWSNGIKYVGGWKDDKAHGQGTQTFPNGNKYVGEWKDDNYHGQGTFTWSNGEKYVGEFMDGKRTGQGTHTWPSGNKYVGEFMDSKKHGQGTFTWPDGERYMGGYKDGKEHGHGTYTWYNGDKYVGEWKDGKRHGQGTQTFGSASEWAGEKYVGMFKNNKRHGQGILTWSNGDKYVGEFKDGEFVDSKGGNIISKSSDQTSVYSTKNSRTYHRHNCPKLNTDDLIEFSSPQKADAAGAIPCEYCNPSPVRSVDEQQLQYGNSNKVPIEQSMISSKQTPAWEPGDVIELWNDALSNGDVNIARKYTSMTLYSTKYYESIVSLENLSEIYQKSKNHPIKSNIIDSKIDGDIAWIIYNVTYKDGSVKQWKDKLLLENGQWKVAPQFNVVENVKQRTESLSSVAFILTKCGKGFSGTRYGNVRGDVPLSIDLGNDVIVKRILNDAKLFAKEECPPTGSYGAYYTRVKLYQLDGKFPQFKDDIMISAQHKDNADTRKWSDARKWYIENNSTVIANKKLDVVKKEKEKKEEAKRFDEFESKNGIKAWVSMDDLFTNPFVYEGKVIGVSAYFWKMESATSGVFTGGGDSPFPLIIVTNIPKGLFTTSDIRIILAGKVLGNIEFTMPLLGPTQVPHLKFVDVYFFK